jgi:hypothetical protein
MAPRSKLVLTVAIVGIVAAITAPVAYSAFFSSSASAGNSLAMGTVAVGDNDSGAATLSLSSAQPGNSDTGCIRVTYTGSLDAGLRLYASVSGSLAPYLTLTVTRGTDASPAFDSCASFTPDATDYLGAGPGVVYSGLLSAYPTSYATGIVDPPSGPSETWTSSEAHSYRVSISLNNDPAAQGLSATTSFTWEARNL